MATDNVIKLIGPGGGGYFRSVKFGRDENHIYLTGDRCGVFYSDNGGANWIPSSGLLNNRMEEVKVDPNNPDHALVASNYGVHESNDGGKTWNYIFKTIDGVTTEILRFTNDRNLYISAVEYSKLNSNIIYAGNGGKHPERSIDKIVHCNFYASEDGGVTWNIRNGSWSMTNAYSIYAIESDPNDVNTVYIAGDMGVWKSIDKGLNWTHIYTEIATSIAVTPGIGERLFMLTYSDPSGNSYWDATDGASQNVYRSDNGGIDWLHKSNGLRETYAYANEIKFDPVNTKNLYIGTMSPVGAEGNLFYKTTDYGENWVAKGVPSLQVINNSLDTENVAQFFDIQDGNLIGTKSDVIISNDDGTTVRATMQVEHNGAYHGTGAEFLDLWNIVEDKIDSNVLWGAVSDWGLIKSTDSGYSWKSYKDKLGNIYLSDGVTKMVSANKVESSPNGTLFMLFHEPGFHDGGAIYRSTTNGETWEKLTTGLPLDKLPWEIRVENKNNHIYADINYDGLYKSTDNGDSWTLNNYTRGTAPVIEFDPKNNDIVYYSYKWPYVDWANDFANGDYRGVFKSTDAGETWSTFGNPELTHVTSLRVNPNDSTEIWCTQFSTTTGGGGGIWKSSDSGETWVHKFNPTVDDLGLPLEPGTSQFYGFFIDPEHTNIMFALTGESQEYFNMWRGGGLWKSEDGGETWNVFPTFGQLTSFQNGLSYTPTNRKLYACIDQLSAWEISLDEVSVVDIIAPSNLTTSISGINNIQLNWIDNSDNETGFTIDRNGTTFSVPVNVTSFLDEGLSDGTYLYKIKAYSDSIGDSTWSNISSINININPPPTNRVTNGLLVLYDFSESTGTIVNDSSGVGDPMNLTIHSTVEWTSDGLKVNDNSVSIDSTTPATKIIDACKLTNELTVEVWIIPSNLTQNGPARIATLSRDSSNRNFTLGQYADVYQNRIRTSETDSNALPNDGSGYFDSTTSSTKVELQHVVFTYGNGFRTIYINGVENNKLALSGDFSTWDNTYLFAIANELVNNETDRSFLGEYKLTAIYNKVLTSAEVLQNYDVGYEDNIIPTITTISQTPIGTLDVNDIVEFTCTTNGTNVTYTWFKNNIPVGNDSNMYSFQVTSADSNAIIFCSVTGTLNNTDDSNSITLLVNDGDETKSRITDGLQLLYKFNNGSGTTIYDVSGVGTSYDLTIHSKVKGE